MASADRDRGARGGGPWPLLGLLLFLVAAAGCGDDGTGPSAEDLIGIWGAVSYQFNSDEDPDQSVDLIADEGATFSIELRTGGGYHRVLNYGGTHVDTGTFEVVSGQLILRPADGEREVYDLSFNNIFLTLRASDRAWDFGGDGTLEPVDVVIVLDRF